ncbi:MAG TPA: hypothetical protein VKM72_33470 [Thermoanaerobaculia bacterium]|nr:hypothetical protein [Thermoanaerobaculia bacterium]
MAAWIRASALLLAGILASAAALQAGTPAVPSGEDWYPADVAPPPGTQYPCALTALPSELPGIPAGDRRFINHVYSMLLRATQAKLVLQKALAGGQGPALASAHGQYRRVTGDALAKIRAEPVPAGLDKFRENVTAALDLQRTAFERAVQARIGGGPVGEEYKVPAARAASQQLIAAWTQMMLRYPDWPAEMKDSVYHHLCALDLF